MKPTLRTESRKIFKIFNVGNYVMVQIYLKRFPSGTVKMLHVHNAESFKIMNKLNCNTLYIFLEIVRILLCFSRRNDGLIKSN